MSDEDRPVVEDPQPRSHDDRRAEDERRRRGRTGLLAVVLAFGSLLPVLWLAFATDYVTQRPDPDADPAFHQPCCMQPEDWSSLLFGIPVALACAALVGGLLALIIATSVRAIRGRWPLRDRMFRIPVAMVVLEAFVIVIAQGRAALA